MCSVHCNQYVTVQWLVPHTVQCSGPVHTGEMSESGRLSNSEEEFEEDEEEDDEVEETISDYEYSDEQFSSEDEGADWGEAGQQGSEGGGGDTLHHWDSLLILAVLLVALAACLYAML